MARLFCDARTDTDQDEPLRVSTIHERVSPARSIIRLGGLWPRQVVVALRALTVGARGADWKRSIDAVRMRYSFAYVDMYSGETACSICDVYSCASIAVR